MALSELVCHAEARSVLRERFHEVLLWDDIRTLRGRMLPPCDNRVEESAAGLVLPSLPRLQLLPAELVRRLRRLGRSLSPPTDSRRIARISSLLLLCLERRSHGARVDCRTSSFSWS